MKKLLSLCFLLFLAAACSSPAAISRPDPMLFPLGSPTKAEYINKQRNELLPYAQAGNAESQYQLGNFYCCGTAGFFSTEEALLWWCKAAAQGHKDAALKLEQHYADSAILNQATTCSELLKKESMGQQQKVK